MCYKKRTCAGFRITRLTCIKNDAAQVGSRRLGGLPVQWFWCIIHIFDNASRTRTRSTHRDKKTDRVWNTFSNNVKKQTRAVSTIKAR